MHYQSPPVLVYATLEDVAALVALVDAGYKARQGYGAPVSRTQRRIAAEILAAYRTMSKKRHTDVEDTPPPEPESRPVVELTTAEVAQLIGKSVRQTCRLAQSLGGARKVGNTWLWPAPPEVHEFAEYLKENS